MTPQHALAAALHREVHGSTFGKPDGCGMRAADIIDRLAAAGWRLVPATLTSDELDEVERLTDEVLAAPPPAPSELREALAEIIHDPDHEQCRIGDSEADCISEGLRERGYSLIPVAAQAGLERLDRGVMNAVLRDPHVDHLLHAYSYSKSEQAEAICAEYDRAALAAPATEREP